MAHFDAAQDLERTLSVRRWIAVDHIADVRDEFGFATIAPEIDATEVKVALVGAANEVAHHRDGAVDDQRHRRGNSNRTEIAGVAPGGGEYLCIVCPTPRTEIWQ